MVAFAYRLVKHKQSFSFSVLDIRCIRRIHHISDLMADGDYHNRSLYFNSFAEDSLEIS
jgi:hypothetical protein